MMKWWLVCCILLLVLWSFPPSLYAAPASAPAPASLSSTSTRVQESPEPLFFVGLGVSFSGLGTFLAMQIYNGVVDWDTATAVQREEAQNTITILLITAGVLFLAGQVVMTTTLLRMENRKTQRKNAKNARSAVTGMQRQPLLRMEFE